MSTTDYDVIKDIPGYKVILKTVLKSQIQQLVEQLATVTDEESVILTASVVEGTLSHLGSESGKNFLDDHEEIKSQFLGFCLKSRHKKQKEEQDRKAAKLLQQTPQVSSGQYTVYRAGTPGSSPRGQTSVHPVVLTKASRGARTKSTGIRHEPYVVPRPQRRSSGNLDKSLSPASEPSASAGQLIKVEPLEKTETENETTGQDNVRSDSDDKNDDLVSESSTSTILNEPASEGHGDDFDTSGAISDNPVGDMGDFDANVSIKVEAVNESEMDLEITGVKPDAMSVSQDNWDQNVSLGLGASGNQSDLTNQGYNKVAGCICHICGKDYKTKFGLKRHLTVHLDLKPSEFFCCGRYFPDQYHMKRHRTSKHGGPRNHVCHTCGKSFAEKNQLLKHQRTETKEGYVMCDLCGTKCRDQKALIEHKNTHSSEKRCVCWICGKRFKHRSSLSRHKLKHKNRNSV